MKRWLKAILIDSIIVTLIIMGGFYQIEWAYNIIIFTIWFFNIVGILAVFLDEETAKKTWKKRSKNFTVYHHATDIISLLMMVSLGWFWISIFRAISKFIMEVKYRMVFEEKEPK